MLEFGCYHCRSPIAVSESARGTSVVCYTCNTRQPVPDNAVVVSEISTERDSNPPKAPPPRGGQWAPVDTVPPVYSGLHFCSCAIIIVGIIECLLGFFLAVAVGPAMFFGVVSGVITIGLGLGLLCLRDIAVDVWHIRRQ